MESFGGWRQRLLIIFPGALGDLICLLPALGVIRARHPGEAVELMARAELARFAVGRCGIATPHSIDRAEVGQLFSASGAPSDAARTFFGAFDHIYSFFAADNAQFRRGLTAVARAVSFYPFRPPGDGHVAMAYLRAIGAPGDTPIATPVTPTTVDLAAATTILDRAGLRPTAFLLLLPGSGSRTKNWPIAHFIALARAVAPRLRPLALLGPAEDGLADALRSGGIPVLDKLELGVVAGLARLAQGFVGNDSGVSHLAAATGARGVAIFGPTDPDRWRPLGAVEVIWRPSLEDIGVDEVIAAVERLSS